MTRATLVTIMSSATIAVIVYFLAFRNPRDFTFGHAIAVLFLALAATASTEQAREMLRKPYVVGRHMYSNGVRKNSDVARFNKEGYLTHSIWATEEERASWARIDAQKTPEGKPVFAAQLPEADQAIQHARGELILRGQCMACHTTDGYRSLKRLLQERDREAIGNVLQMLHEYKDDSPYRAYMPPLVGTSEEIVALGDYLDHLVNRGKKQPKPVTVAEVPQAAPANP